MNNKSLVVYGTQSIIPTVVSGQILYAQGIRQYVPDGMDDDERRKVLRDASLVYEALVRVSTRYNFYGALLDGASALLDRYGELIGEFEREARLRYAMKCCVVASGRLFEQLRCEMKAVPSIIHSRQTIRGLGLNPDVMESMSMDNWRWAGFSECEKTGICFHAGSEHPPFMDCCSLDKTRLPRAEKWRGDDGCYEPVRE
ncbi:MAG TPA: hypothetical protein VN420_05950 [Candidatus Fimivivens sp.]|nr:hypothetical protein [Candidatus Fimivivens sp.]